MSFPSKSDVKYWFFDICSYIKKEPLECFCVFLASCFVVAWIVLLIALMLGKVPQEINTVSITCPAQSASSTVTVTIPKN